MFPRKVKSGKVRKIVVLISRDDVLLIALKRAERDLEKLQVRVWKLEVELLELKEELKKFECRRV